MKRKILTLVAVVLSLSALYSQTINYSSIKVKTMTQNREYPYEQFVIINYGRVETKWALTGNVLGVQYGQVHIGGWYVSADMSLSSLHFSSSPSKGLCYDQYSNSFYTYGDENRSVYDVGKFSFNRISFGAGGIVRMVVPLYFYLGLGYCYQNVTVKTEEYGWLELEYSNYYYDIKCNNNPHSSGYLELGLQGNINGLTLRTGYRYNFHGNHEFSVGVGWTFCRKSKNGSAKVNE